MWLSVPYMSPRLSSRYLLRLSSSSHRLQNPAMSSNLQEPDRPVKEEDVKFELDDRTEPSRDGAAPAKRGRPTENPCWGYFIRLDDQNVRCRLCNKVTSALSRFYCILLVWIDPGRGGGGCVSRKANKF